MNDVATTNIWLDRFVKTKNEKFLKHKPIVAEMLRTYAMQPEVAGRFWDLVFSEEHPEADHASRELARRIQALKGANPKLLPAAYDKVIRFAARSWQPLFDVWMQAFTVEVLALIREQEPDVIFCDAHGDPLADDEMPKAWGFRRANGAELMSFTMRELLGGQPPAVRPREPEPELMCPTGKAAFATKAAADRALLRINPGERTRMQRFRCAICEHFHLGHRRGAIL